MGKHVIVQGDAVQGTDLHNVTGPGTTTAAPPTPATYVGIGSFVYNGAMTSALSTFVKIGGSPVAVVTSKSSLNPGEDVPPKGAHSGPQGSNFLPTAPIAPTPGPLSITDAIGTGMPNAAAGSAVLTIGGAKALLDGDKIDTCDGTHAPGNSTVTSSGQSFVTCSG